MFKVSIDYFTLCDIIETLAAGATDLLVFQICNNFFYIFTISFKISWYLGTKYNIILHTKFQAVSSKTSFVLYTLRVGGGDR